MALMSVGVTERVRDSAFENELANKLRGLASSGASAEWLASFLDETTAREVLPWQVGEAVAETVLAGEHGVTFPWNVRRDQRNPRASLQGADIVGFSDGLGGPQFVFGEVKSSSDQSSPPTVVVGRSGLDKQLERLIGDKKLQFTLLKWLYARVGDAPGSTFANALAAFIESQGELIRLIGVLVRDTPANERDVSERVRTLGDQVRRPGSVEIYVMYMPRPMTEWEGWVAA